MPTYAIQHKKTKKWLLRTTPDRYDDFHNEDEMIYTSPHWDVAARRGHELDDPLAVDIIKIHDKYPMNYKERLSKYGGQK